MTQRKQTIKRKTAGKKQKKSNGNPQRNALRISVHRTQVILLLLFFAAVGVGLGCCLWNAGSKAVDYANRDTRYDRLIVKYGLKNGVDPTLLKAVIWKESNFNKDARGSKGEVGLMQLLPEGAVKDWEERFQRKVLSEGALSDPELNIEIGSWYLGRAMEHWKEYNDCEALALCEYNAGFQRANYWKPGLHHQKVIQNIDIESTRKYVEDILNQRKVYQRDWDWEKTK